MIQLLHGFDTHFILDNPNEIRETMKCNADDVVTSMALASSIEYHTDGEIILNDELWNIVKESSHLLKLLTFAETSHIVQWMSAPKFSCVHDICVSSFR